MSHRPEPTIVTTPKGLAALLPDLFAQPAVAVDTESNSLYAYNERICLIQFSTPDFDAIVDPLARLDVTPLGELFADPAVQKVFHAAEQDVAGLRRDIGCQFANLFDTMWAARILGWSRVGLADVLQETFGIHTDKRYQRYNWGKRPLDAQALAYARRDTRYLLPLREMQVEALARMGRDEEAAEVFAQLAQTAPAGPTFGPDAFWRMKGIHDVEGRELAVLWELYMWRDQEAARRNRPPFKVVSNRVLLALASLRPRKTGQMEGIRGLTPYLIRRYGRPLLEAVARGETGPIPTPPPQPPRPDRAVLARYQALRDWRRGVAARRQVDTDVVLSNATLWALAERNPSTVADLQGIEGLGPWKRQEYGAKILRVLAKR
ncbi:MAG: HRDC domain-containing protein [Anaerolineae bacterium]|nr:HRDC domain-containing protein [Anaerolineae bacterium]